MSDPNPIPINPVLMFVNLPIDVAVHLCRYIPLQTVEAIGSTCRAARERWTAMQNREDFKANVHPAPRFLMNDWSRPSQERPFWPKLWSGDGFDLSLSMNARGDYLFAHNEKPTASDLKVYRHTSQSPLRYRHHCTLSILGMRMVGMDNDPNNPGVYLWNPTSHDLYSWHLKGGLTLVGHLPMYTKVTAHSRGGDIHINAVDEAGSQLIAQPYTRTDNGLTPANEPNVLPLEHPNIGIKLSPGGHSLMLLGDDRLQVLSSTTLQGHLPPFAVYPNHTPLKLSYFSITDDGGTLFHGTAIIALNRYLPIYRREGYYRMAHCGSGKCILRTEMITYTPWNYQVFAPLTYQLFATSKLVSPELEAAFDTVERLYDKFYLDRVKLDNIDVFTEFLRQNVHEPSVRNALRTIQNELQHATSSQLSAFFVHYLDHHCRSVRASNTPYLFHFLCDLANSLDLDDPDSPIKEVIPYWYHPVPVHERVNTTPVHRLLRLYSNTKSVQRKILLLKIFASRGREYDPYLSGNIGNILLYLSRPLPSGETLADVLCQSINRSDRKRQKNLIPKHVREALIQEPELRNYLIIEALLKKLAHWTDDPDKRAQLTVACKAMVTAAEAERNLRYDAQQLMATRFNNGDSVLQCLNGTPHYDTMVTHFGVDAPAAVEEPQRLGCKF